jgi:hypothetical protein
MISSWLQNLTEHFVTFGRPKGYQALNGEDQNSWGFISDYSSRESRIKVNRLQMDSASLSPGT